MKLFKKKKKKDHKIWRSIFRILCMVVGGIPVRWDISTTVRCPPVLIRSIILSAWTWRVMGGPGLIFCKVRAGSIVWISSCPLFLKFANQVQIVKNAGHSLGARKVQKTFVTSFAVHPFLETDECIETVTRIAISLRLQGALNRRHFRLYSEKTCKSMWACRFPKKNWMVDRHVQAKCWRIFTSCCFLNHLKSIHNYIMQM